MAATLKAGRLCWALATAGFLLPVQEIAAETLRVGPTERFKLPSQAAAVAREGDTVRIAPGQYRDCAVWRTARLTIVGAGAEAVQIGGPVCDGKALFVLTAPGITIEGITFRGAAAPDGNGAGIRAEGGDLTVRHVQFEDSESGILTRAEMPAARLLIEDSVFLGNGAMRGAACSGHALYVGHLAAVIVQRTRFEAQRACHHVKSRAARTEITDSSIVDGPLGGSSYLIDLPNGGDLVLARTRLMKGPRTGNRRAAVVIGAEGVLRPTSMLLIEGNRFENRTGGPTIFVENRSTAPARLEGNTLEGLVLALTGPGTVR
ncbi:hypothetical protein AAFN86_06795 [Roseomonas sp. CAU 1739]|uniref:hypothetical protein n=1 Tax=Roseomonas sp. CAU 1739 TaxID=3140364 RepID=UPI00325ACEF8